MIKRDREAFNERYVNEKFVEGFGCAQVILEYFAQKSDENMELSKKIAGPFTAGMYQADLCGAYTGGLMAMGMIYGYSEPNDIEKKGNMIAKVTEFQMIFEERHKSFKCECLLGGNLTVEEDAKKIEDAGLLTTFCPKLVLDVIDIIEGLE